MLPPVPAILLTVNGGAPGSDEISVVWTFVIRAAVMLGGGTAVGSRP